LWQQQRTTDTLEKSKNTTRRYNPEDSHIRTHRRENLKSYYRSQYYYRSKYNENELGANEGRFILFMLVIFFSVANNVNKNCLTFLLYLIHRKGR
jgi:uncharacterized protein YfeS